jgi:hypothetical protein
MSSQFELTRDIAGQISYGLSITNMRNEGAILAKDTQDFITLGENDKYAVFLPSLGGDYLVSAQQITDYGVGSFAPNNAVLNIAHIDFLNWPEDLLNSGQKNLYVYAVGDDLQIAVLIGQGNRK